MGCRFCTRKMSAAGYIDNNVFRPTAGFELQSPIRNSGCNDEIGIFAAFIAVNVVIYYMKPADKLYKRYHLPAVSMPGKDKVCARTYLRGICTKQQRPLPKYTRTARGGAIPSVHTRLKPRRRKSKHAFTNT